jgi:hypothetical protein
MFYSRPNRRRCYWLCRDCLKGRSQCSTKCPDYVSVAQAERTKREKDNAVMELSVIRDSGTGYIPKQELKSEPRRFRPSRRGVGKYGIPDPSLLL